MSQSGISSTKTTEVPVEALDLSEPVIPIIPIGVALPPSISPVGGNGVVGSVVIMGEKSAMVWVSFGPLDTTTESVSSGTKNQSFRKWTNICC